MKNLVLFLFISLAITICSALVIKEKGSEEIYVISAKEIKDIVNINTKNNVNYQAGFFSQIFNLNKLILVETDKEELVDKNAKKIKSLTDLKKEKQERPAYLIWFALLSVVFMIVSNILFIANKGFDRLSFTTVFISVFAIIAALSSLVASFLFAYFGFATALSAFSAYTIISGNYKGYKFSSVLYYMLMITIFILFI